MDGLKVLKLFRLGTKHTFSFFFSGKNAGILGRELVLATNHFSTTEPVYETNQMVSQRLKGLSKSVSGTLFYYINSTEM